jgi:plasmid stabilization system protein ParE
VTAAERRHRLLDGAREDLRHAAQWYEERAAGAGAALVLAIDQAISKDLEAPKRWPALGASYQHYVLRRYPYSVVYRLCEDVVFIVAIAHHSRAPNYWRDRDEKGRP